MNKDADRIPAFLLIDPLKRFAPEGFGWAEEWGKDWGAVQILPRISVPGLSDPVFAEPAPFPSRDDIIDTGALVRRIAALKSALDNLPRQALRLARWKARGRAGAQGRCLETRPPEAHAPRLRAGLSPDEQARDRQYYFRRAFFCVRGLGEVGEAGHVLRLLADLQVSARGGNSGRALARPDGCVRHIALSCAIVPLSVAASPRHLSPWRWLM